MKETIKWRFVNQKIDAQLAKGYCRTDTPQIMLSMYEQQNCRLQQVQSPIKTTAFNRSGPTQDSLGPRPNQPQHGSLLVSHAGNTGSDTCAG